MKGRRDGVRGDKWCHLSSRQSERGSGSRLSQTSGATGEWLQADRAVPSQSFAFLDHYSFEMRLRKKKKKKKR